MESQHLNALCVAGSLPLPHINIHTGHCLMTPFSVGMWSRKRNRGNQKIIYCNRNIPLFEASSEKKIKRGTFPPVPNFTKQILFPVKSLRLLYEECEIGVIEFPTPHVSHSGASCTKIPNPPTVSKKPAPSPHPMLLSSVRFWLCQVTSNTGRQDMLPLLPLQFSAPFIRFSAESD